MLRQRIEERAVDSRRCERVGGCVPSLGSGFFVEVVHSKNAGRFRVLVLGYGSRHSVIPRWAVEP